MRATILLIAAVCVCDSEVLTQAEALSNIDELIGDIVNEFHPPGGMPHRSFPFAGRPDRDDDQDNDDGPPILKFRPKGE